MKNKIKLLGIIAVAAFIVIGMTSCDLFSQFGQVEYTLTVENNTTKSNTSNLKVYIKLGSDTWEGTIKAGESHTLTHKRDKAFDGAPYTIQYGINNINEKKVKAYLKRKQANLLGLLEIKNLTSV